jgi:PGF-CTERM protein
LTSDAGALNDVAAAGFLEITTGFADEDVESATAEFEVDAAALEELDASPEDVSLYHYNTESDEWEELETSVTDEGEGTISYSATLEGFSQFAVGIDQPEESSEETNATETNETSDMNETDDESEDTASDEIPGFGVVAALIALLATAAIARRR